MYFVKRLEMKSSWIQSGPKSNILLRRGKDKETHPQREENGDMKMEAETEVMCLQAKEH